MSVGVQVINEFGTFQIDSRFIGFSEQSRGTIPVSYMDNQVYPHGYSGLGSTVFNDGAQLLLRPELNLSIWASSIFYTGNSTYPKGTIVVYQHRDSVGYPYVPVRWVVATPTNYIPYTPDDYGVEVWNQYQQRVFVSGYPFVYLQQTFLIDVRTLTTVPGQVTVTLPSLPVGWDYYVGGLTFIGAAKNYRGYGNIVWVLKKDPTTYILGGYLQEIGVTFAPNHQVLLGDYVVKRGRIAVSFYRVKV